MFNSRNRNNKFTINKPWFLTDTFFSILFGFVICFILATWFVAGYTAYTVVNDPSILGRIAGEVVSGFNEKVK